jgi:hypothetical protein
VECIYLYISDDVIYDKAAFEALMAQGISEYIYTYMHIYMWLVYIHTYLYKYIYIHVGDIHINNCI